ncbi:MAG: hypothetical protein MUO24_02255 [Desulfobacterales bacterium]|nr:hypothetical protein [Desulfobacterales bacterium]
MDWKLFVASIIALLDSGLFQQLLALALSVVKAIEELFKGGELVSLKSAEKRHQAIDKLHEQYPDAPLWQKNLAMELAVAHYQLEGWGDPTDQKSQLTILNEWGYRPGPGAEGVGGKG